MNEELIVKKTSSENIKSKRGRCKKNANKKKHRSNSGNSKKKDDEVVSPNTHLNSSNDNIEVETHNTLDHANSYDSPCESEKNKNISSKKKSFPLPEKSKPTESSSHVTLDVKSETKVCNKNPHNSITSDSGKMSWRKMTHSQPLHNSGKTKLDEEDKLNKDEIYVNDLVKNLLKKIISEEEKGVAEDRDEKEEEFNDEFTKSKLKNTFAKQNKKTKTNSGQNKYKPFSKIHSNVSSSNETKEKSYNNKNEESIKSKTLKKNFDKENEKSTKQELTSSLKKNIKSKKYLKNEVEDLAEDVQNHDRKDIIEQNDNALVNITQTKNFSSDNECKIVSNNHDSIQKNDLHMTHLRSDSKKQMKDSSSQTESKINKNKENLIEVAKHNLSEAVHSTTHDEEEKPVESQNPEDKNSSKNTNLIQKNNVLKTEKNQKKKKKNLFVNNFKADVDVTKNNQQGYGLNNLDKKNNFASIDCHLELRKLHSEGYNLPNKKDNLKTNSNTSTNFISNQNIITNTISSSRTSNNNYNKFKKPSETKNPTSPRSTTTNTWNANATTSSNTPNNESKMYFNDKYYHNYNDEYNEDESYSSTYYKPKYNYKGNYYNSNSYCRKSKYGAPNYYNSNSNKFNNSNESGYTNNNKVFNNRGFYSRTNYDYCNSANFQMFGNNPMMQYNMDTSLKESPVYNNFYIINSNVNINNVQNFNQEKSTAEDSSSNSTGAIEKSNESYTPYTPPDKSYSPLSNRINFSNYHNLPMENLLANNFAMPINMFGPIPYMRPPGFTAFIPNYVNNQDIDPDNLLLNKIEGDIYPFTFYYRIHNDIIDYSTLVSKAINTLKSVKMYVIKLLENNIKQIMGEEITIDLYGSFATELSIESSDIDITIRFGDEKTEVDIDDIFDKLCIHFREINIFDFINPIMSASVPVIKILIDPMKILKQDSEEFKTFENFKSSELFKNYKFDKEELLKIKVDLSFIELNKNLIGKGVSTKNSLSWARKTLDVYPEIKPIIHVLKRYLQIKKLNSSFNGGLSSFSLFLLIVGYLKYPKMKTRINLGRILMEMLELYGKYYHFAQSAVDVNAIK